MIKSITIIVLFLLMFLHSKAQNFENLLLANKDDAGKLTSAYLKPITKGLIYGMNKGWYHTAKVHKKFGFDISFGVMGSFVPSKDEIFDVTKLGLSNNTKVINGINNTPTILGDDSKDAKRSEIEVSNSVNLPIVGKRRVSTKFTLPEGKDFPVNIIPGIYLQAGIGLPCKFEAMVRFIPKVGASDVKVGLFGIGLKREITDWLGPIGKLPFHVSLLAAYNNVGADYKIDNNASSIVSPKNASAEFRSNSYTIQAITSLNFPIINFYGGVGYSGGNTKLNMLGDYSLKYAGTSVPVNVKDPLSLKSSSGSFGATIGARLSFGFFKIFGSYTLQEYNSLNAGLAFSFR